MLLLLILSIQQINCTLGKWPHVTSHSPSTCKKLHWSHLHYSYECQIQMCSRE